MSEDLRNKNSFYYPSFFKMHIDTDDEFNTVNIQMNSKSKLSDTASAMLLHEYVHYLQDITTIFGLSNIIHIVDFIKHVNGNQYNSGESDLFIPVNIDKTWGDFFYFDSERLRTLKGSVNNIQSGIIQKIEPIWEKIEFQNVSKNSLRIRITILLPNGHNEFYYFGTHSIMESMAYEIEQCIYPNLIRNDYEYPYLCARKIIECVFPEFLIIPNGLITLLDASLQYPDPPGVFYAVLCFLKKSNSELVGIDLYAITIRIMESQYNYVDSFEDVIISKGREAINQLCSYFNQEKYGNTRQWIENVIVNSTNYRKEHKNLFSLIAMGGRIQENSTFQYVYNLLGTPLISNNLGENIIYSKLNTTLPNIYPQYLWVVSDMLNIYINSKRSIAQRCSLYGWCNQNNQDTDDRCFNSPWERVKEDNLCSFAQIWHDWNMSKYTPKER